MRRILIEKKNMTRNLVSKSTIKIIGITQISRNGKHNQAYQQHRLLCAQEKRQPTSCNSERGGYSDPKTTPYYTAPIEVRSAQIVPTLEAIDKIQLRSANLTTEFNAFKSLVRPPIKRTENVKVERSLRLYRALATQLSIYK